MPLPQSRRLKYSQPAPGAMDWRLIAALAFTLVLWASAFAAIRFCLRPGAYNPGHLALLRFLVASITMLLSCVFFKVRLPDARDVPTFFAMGFLGVALYHTALNFGQTTVGAGAASFLINTAPAFTALLALLVLKEKMRVWGWAGIALSMTGIFIIASGKKGGMQFDPNAFLIVLSALGASFHVILNKQILQRYTALESTTFTVLCGTLFLLIFTPGFLSTVTRAPLNATIAAIYIGVFPAALAYVSWAYVLSRLPASQTMTFLYLMPGLAIVIAWIWLGETPTFLTLIGGSLALAGVVLVNTFGKTKIQSIRVAPKK